MRLPGMPHPPRLLLELDLTRGVVEGPPATPLQAIRGRGVPVLRDVVEGLRRAAGDAAVVGLVAHVGGGALSLAQAGELRDAVEGFARSSKPTVAWTESFGELVPGNVDYWLATGFAEIWLQPVGDVGLVGVTAEAVFLRGALDKLHVQAQIGQRHEYKSAANTFTQEGFTDAHREMATRLADSATETIVAGVATGRGLTEDAVRAVIDGGPVPAAQAGAQGLVDRLGHRAEVYADVRARVDVAGSASGSGSGSGSGAGSGAGSGSGSSGRSSGRPSVGWGRSAPRAVQMLPRRARRSAPAELRFVERYGKGAVAGVTGALGSKVRSISGQGGPVVAVVHAAGPIGLGRSSASPLSASGSIGSDSLCGVLRAAGRDDDVRAVVLRVDSPGGSYIASDAIRHEVLALRAAGTPVVASMGSVAASGGYYIAMGADRVLAQPGTITGSIGVLAGKQVTAGALDRIGVAVDSVSTGRYADMLSSQRPFTDEEWARLDEWLDRVYADFTAKAAVDRQMDVDRLRSLARGRVWTGADAVAHGLVDAVGGLEEAIGQACTLASVERADVALRSLPRPGFIERLMPAENSESPAAAGVAVGVGDLAVALGPAARALGLPAGVLSGLAGSVGLPGGALMLPADWNLR